MNDTEFIRINKFLSEIGYCSRRRADKLIEQGKIKVNGRVPTLGTKISSNDKITVNGKTLTIEKNKKNIYLAFHKPRGIVCTTDQVREKDNIIDYIDYLPISTITLENIEADDTMAYLTKQVMKTSKIVLMSTDKDFLQLVNHRVSVWSPTKKKMYDPPKV